MILCAEYIEADTHIRYRLVRGTFGGVTDAFACFQHDLDADAPIEVRLFGRNFTAADAYFEHLLNHA